MEEKSKAQVVVLGSANLDYNFKVDRLPKLGETLQCQKYWKCLGGKGTNQAIAVARANASCTFLAQIGNDEAGKMQLDALKSSNVHTEKVRVLEKYPTGGAYIFILPSGENSIIIEGGANIHWEIEENALSPAHEDALINCDALLMQREISEKVNILASAKAFALSTDSVKLDKCVVLDVGGQDLPLPEEFLKNISIISPNQTELERILGKSISEDATEEELHQACQSLREKYENLEVLLKLGSRGSLFVGKGLKIRVKACCSDSLQIIDTIGAGDTYTGYFTVRYVEMLKNGVQRGTAIEESMKLATAAAFLSITREGAVPSIPTRKEVEEFAQSCFNK